MLFFTRQANQAIPICCENLARDHKLSVQFLELQPLTEGNAHSISMCDVQTKILQSPSVEHRAFQALKLYC